MCMHEMKSSNGSTFCRTPTPTPQTVSPLVARRQLGVGRGTRAPDTASSGMSRPGGPSAQLNLLQRVIDRRNNNNNQLQFP